MNLYEKITSHLPFLQFYLVARVYAKKLVPRTLLEAHFRVISGKKGLYRKNVVPDPENEKKQGLGRNFFSIDPFE